VPKKPIFLLCLLFLFVAANGQTVQANSWIARSSTGLTLMGTWTAVPDPASETVTGTWTLVDAQGRTLGSGGWSAAKSPAGWSGAWRAVADASKADFSGTWRSSVHLKRDARFADLFAKAAQAVVGGTWRIGGRTGTWSIRAFK